ncbi:MAG: hypothetical protein KJ971_01605 [Firmicutes bacterium]|nr:hypothetical protein [Bacillota bacterium]
MNQFNNGRINTSKVYYLNEENKQKVINEKNVVYSEDGKYVLIYTQDDYDFMERFWGLYDKDEYYRNMSIEDTIYDEFLHEADVEPFLPDRTRIHQRKLDLMNEQVISFAGKSIFPACIINKQKSLVEGSDIIITIGHTDEHSLVISIKENENV